MQHSCIQSCLAHSMNAAALHAIKNWILRNFSTQNSKDDAGGGACLSSAAVLSTLRGYNLIQTVGRGPFKPPAQL